MTKCIVRIAEGIGNQLFMFANSLSFSRRIGYSLYIDNKSGYFQKKNIRFYQLDKFNLDTPICDDEYKFNNPLKNLKRKFLINIDRFKQRKSFILEPKDNLKRTKFCNLNKHNLSNLLYIEGYFESEKYFSDIKQILKKKITLKDQYIYENNEYFSLIKNNPNVVSICIRQNRYSERLYNRYNFESKKKSSELTKITIDYIKRAVKYIDTKITKPRYLIWSDDFSNLREYFPLDKYLFVDIKENKSLSDFYLLLNCKNFIVGPTSFHWWPAWLNFEKTSIVLRPKNISTSNNIDFWPENWMSI